MGPTAQVAGYLTVSEREYLPFLLLYLSHTQFYAAQAAPVTSVMTSPPPMEDDEHRTARRNVVGDPDS